MPVTYRLSTSVVTAPGRPPLDADQQRVVDHESGPLLVLAGPGTGKTTTLVEAVVERVERRGLSPEQVLVLTFGRQAAGQLRDRITARLQRTSATPMCSTFHAFCYGLVRSTQPPDLYATPLQVLNAPEQDVRLRELLAHSPDVGSVDWPASLVAGLGTRGLAHETRVLLARSRDLGLEPVELTRLGVESGRPEWAALGRFMDEYLAVLDFEAVLDYSELVHRAVLVAESTDVRTELRQRYAAVFVDEFQDTDQGQVRLLQALAGDGRDLVVVGDPDQSIYAFRGAEVRGILDFPDRFRSASGARAPVVALGTTRRYGPRLARLSRRVAAGIGVSGAIDATSLRRFRQPDAVGPDGSAEVLLCTSTGAQADHVADLIRRAHLEDEVPWREIAVLVRSGTQSIPGLRRALGAAGVPVEVSGDEVPLRAEPAVQPLLDALAAAVDPSAMSAETAHALLLSPLGSVDAGGLRRLARLLRRRAMAESRDVAASAVLVRGALADPLSLADLTDPSGPVEPATVACRRLGDLLATAHEELVGGASAEQVLWTLWQGTPWPRRLRALVERGGDAARGAHRDLDSVCALFDVAARAEERRAHQGVASFLDEVRAQQIPSDSRYGGAGSRDAVRLLTAHRSKGLEWRMVVVAGVQEDSWPDLRRRGTLLQADRLGPGGVREPASTAALLAEERRLFYVAVTRARERLVVTAVESDEDDGLRPSRFVEALGLVPRRLVGRPARPLSLAGTVGALRRVAGDPDASAEMRRAAASRLARLVGERGASGARAPGADPARWWGLRAETVSESPVRPADEPVALSGSGVSGLLACPLRSFLGREAAGETSRGPATAFGNVIHAVADHLARSGDATDAELLELVDTVWGRVRFESDWIAAREHDEVARAVGRLLAWHRAARGRTLLDSEADFDVEVAVPDGEPVRLRGRVDRVETDHDDRVHVVDFKTTKQPPTAPKVSVDAQLGVYQAAAAAGAFGDRVVGGAELVQLRTGEVLPKVQHQAPQPFDADGRRPIDVQLRTAAGLLREERFPAQLNALCTRCEFRGTCPAQLSSPTVLSGPE